MTDTVRSHRGRGASLPRHREWPVDLYDAALDRSGVLAIRRPHGVDEAQDLDRWTAPADAVDRTVLDRCPGPTVDLGCGPGRLTAALASRGVPALGVDVSARAVAMTRARGAAAVRRDLFARLPGEGRWSAALLIDGNIGIGGDPERLLDRVARLVRAQGDLLVEVEAADVDERGRVRLVAGGVVSHSFPWARVGPAALRRAAAVRWTVREEWTTDGRAFVHLARRSPSGGRADSREHDPLASG
jgi:SAM-dependent methyltransferase